MLRSVLCCCSCLCLLICASQYGNRWSAVLVPFRNNTRVLSSSRWEVKRFCFIGIVSESGFTLRAHDWVYPLNQSCGCSFFFLKFKKIVSIVYVLSLDYTKTCLIWWIGMFKMSFVFCAWCMFNYVKSWCEVVKSSFLLNRLWCFTSKKGWK